MILDEVMTKSGTRIVMLDEQRCFYDYQGKLYNIQLYPVASRQGEYYFIYYEKEIDMVFLYIPKGKDRG